MAAAMTRMLNAGLSNRRLLRASELGFANAAAFTAFSDDMVRFVSVTCKQPKAEAFAQQQASALGRAVMYKR